MQLLNRLVLTALLMLATTQASAQTLRGTITVGVAVSTVRPAAAGLKTKTSLTPTFGRVPSSGWGVAVAFHWFDTDADARVVGGAGPLGRITVRPLMLGIGYTAVFDRLSVSPSFVAGPALNTVVISSEARERFEVTGTTFQKKVGTISLATRPGVGFTYALKPRLGLTAFGGYIVNRPNVALRTPDGERSHRWRTDGVLLSTGIVVTVF